MKVVDSGIKLLLVIIEFRCCHSRSVVPVVVCFFLEEKGASS